MGSVAKLLVKEQPISYGASAKYPTSAELVKKFTTQSRFGDPIQLYEQTSDGKFMFLPRAVCPVGGEDLRVRGHPVNIGMKTQAKDAEQARIYGECLELLGDDKSFILQAGTGTGKTWVGLALAAALGVPTLVVCTKDDLVTQWRQRILQHTDVPASKIGRIQQDVCDVYGKSIVIASLKSLAIPDRYPPAIRSLFGFVIYDEVHRLGADTFQAVCRMFPSWWRLGLSATPQRQDGKEITFFANIGPIRVIGESIPMSPKVLRYVSDWKCPRIRQKDKQTGETKLVRLPHMPGKAGHVLKYLLRDQDRNRLIVWMMKKCWENKRNTVIFSSSIDHLELLRDLGVKAGIPRKAFGEYYGSAKEAALDAAAVCPIVLATPGKAGDGTDKPWWDACILASPFANIAQIVGRVVREYPDKLQPVVFDVCDRDSPVFAGYENKRDEYYFKVEAVIKEMENAVAA